MVIPENVLDDAEQSRVPPVLKPVFDLSNPFPALPPIHSKDIECQVFTHRSYHGRPNHVFEDHPRDPSPDNEKYEHLGDSVLSLVVTKVLADNYPLLHVGPSTVCFSGSLVVGNATLANISCQYGLHHRLRLHAAQEVTLRASLNIQADVFESYVGGLYCDQGLPAVETWLKALFIPYVKEAYCHVRAQHGLPPVPLPGNTLTICKDSGGKVDGVTSQGTDEGSGSTRGHLALFNQLMNKKQLDVEWVYTNGGGDGTVTTPIWSVKAEVNGEVYGTGKGRTKKSARNEAAKEGLKRLGVDM
ncbi:ribonuclease III domain-containing protein [Pisolithus marmoratus]|nr:ribonuclease III domain-containing protein [Pisolithus marmoratus]